jgi:chromosome segregation ATPase
MLEEIFKLAKESPAALLIVIIAMMTYGGVKLAPIIMDRLTMRREARDEEKVNRDQPEWLRREMFMTIEERGKRLYDLIQIVAAMRLEIDVLKKEAGAMERKIERLNDQHNQIALDFVELKTDVKHMRDRVEEACERLERIEQPIAEINAWVMRRAQLGPPTP